MGFRIYVYGKVKPHVQTEAPGSVVSRLIYSITAPSTTRGTADVAVMLLTALICQSVGEKSKYYIPIR